VTNSWETPDGALALAYSQHSDTLRGLVRHALVHRALVHHVPEPGRVLDVGGGTAIQARMLARLGHHVTVLDPDPDMVERATNELAHEPSEVRDRVTLIEGRGEQAIELAGGDWPLVCCHGVLMYLEDPDPLLDQLVRATAPGGLISILTKNAAAIPLRPALEGRWGDALALLDTDTETGGLGVTSRGHHLADLANQLADLGAPLQQWYGVRVATDHLRNTSADTGDTPTPNRDLAIELEWALGRRDPYRACGRLLHLLCRREPERSP
jgi:S-adenosylmethionine-dependent methyltransferase